MPKKVDLIDREKLILKDKRVNRILISDIENNFNSSQKATSFFRDYPDIFLDMVSVPEFNLFFYQRLFLRLAMRYKYLYATFPRGFSKSFLSIITLYLKCIFFPGIKLFICAGGKEQAANIAKEKIEEIWNFFPILKKEIVGKNFAKDYVRLIFSNGSRRDIVQVENTARGGRRNSGLIEEVILINGEKLNEIILPLMAVNRVAKNGLVDPNENHKSQIYITTAGYKGSYAYEKQIQLLIWMATKENAFVLGGDYRIPILHGLMDENFIQEMEEDGTYNAASFSREYGSRWSGAILGAFYNPDDFDKARLVAHPESEYRVDSKSKSFYVLGVDVGRFRAQTAITVLKCSPRPDKTIIKSVVNIYVLENKHFEEQAIEIKKYAEKFKVRQVAIDGTGLGAGLVDYLVKEQIDPKTKEIYAPFGVTNSKDYDQFLTTSSKKILYVVKPGASDNSEMYVNLFNQISALRLRFLVTEITARSEMIKAGTPMTFDEKQDILRAHNLTTVLKEEMMNLKQKPDAKEVVLEQANRRFGKDKFSALAVGCIYIKQLENQMFDSGAKKRRKASDYIFFN